MINTEEWSKQNEFNSFNSWKGLLYAPWYTAISQRKFLPPIEASIDPIHDCNLHCQHCNASRFIEDESLPMRKMPDEHLIRLIEFLGKWGVRGACFGGGGESTLHPKLPDAIRRSRKVGMQAAIITNGTIFNEDLLDALMQCRFIGMSVDAAYKETYQIGRKVNLFDTVIKNIAILQEEINYRKANCEIAYKFLIFDYNQYEISSACWLAKSLGVRDFHARPADFSHQGMKEKKSNNYDIRGILRQFEECRKMEDENFRVFTVLHKYDESLNPRKDFSQCYGAPICIQLCADGNVYFCVDTRQNQFYKLGSHYPDPDKILTFWGGERHKSLVFEIGKAFCTSRCTYGNYCRQCEYLFINNHNPMCWEFT